MGVRVVRAALRDCLTARPAVRDGFVGVVIGSSGDGLGICLEHVAVVGVLAFRWVCISSSLALVEVVGNQQFNYVLFCSAYEYTFTSSHKAGLLSSFPS